MMSAWPFLASTAILKCLTRPGTSCSSRTHVAEGTLGRVVECRLLDLMAILSSAPFNTSTWPEARRRAYGFSLVGLHVPMTLLGGLCDTHDESASDDSQIQRVADNTYRGECHCSCRNDWRQQYVEGGIQVLSASSVIHDAGLVLLGASISLWRNQRRGYCSASA